MQLEPLPVLYSTTAPLPVVPVFCSISWLSHPHQMDGKVVGLDRQRYRERSAGSISRGVESIDRGTWLQSHHNSTAAPPLYAPSARAADLMLEVRYPTCH